MWFMHDGAPAHFNRLARQFLNERFPTKWIGGGEPINWPARSPDLNPLDFYLWGHLKSLVYSAPVNDVEELRYRIQEGCRRIQTTLGTFERVRRSTMRRLEACIQAEGGCFKQFL
ncbi:hypothetical protein ANTRET_LOCUS4846 [Anthophora retusa]